MGKNRDIESLIRFIVNTIAHEIVAKHTNRPESRHFLGAEIIEYRGRADKMALEYNWNVKEKEYIREKALIKIKEKLALKYPDVSYSVKEVENLIDEEIKNLL